MEDLINEDEENGYNEDKEFEKLMRKKLKRDSSKSEENNKIKRNRRNKMKENLESDEKLEIESDQKKNENKNLETDPAPKKKKKDFDDKFDFKDKLGEGLSSKFGHDQDPDELKRQKALIKEQNKKKNLISSCNSETLKKLKKEKLREGDYYLYEEFFHSSQSQTYLDYRTKQPDLNYPQKKRSLLTLPHLIKGRKLPFSMSEENHKLVSNLLANCHPENPEKKGIFAYDAHFIFAVSTFIIIVIIVAYILLINYSDLYLQKEEKKMNENKKKYLVSFQKGYQLDSYLFYIGIGFISVSVFVLSLLAIRNVIFSDLKKNKI